MQSATLDMLLEPVMSILVFYVFLKEILQYPFNDGCKAKLDGRNFIRTSNSKKKSKPNSICIKVTGDAFKVANLKTKQRYTEGEKNNRSKDWALRHNTN